MLVFDSMNLFELYYSNIAETVGIEKTLLIVENKAEAVQKKPQEFGNSFPGVDEPTTIPTTIVQYCSSDLLALCEAALMSSILASVKCFKDLMPRKCLGKVIADNSSKSFAAQFGWWLEALNAIEDKEQVGFIIERFSFAASMLLFKRQKIDSYAIHNKSISHSILADSITQQLVDGAILQEIGEKATRSLQLRAQADKRK